MTWRLGIGAILACLLLGTLAEGRSPARFYFDLSGNSPVDWSSSGASPPWVMVGASVDLDFQNGRYYQLGKPGNVAPVSVTRASTAYEDNVAGTWSSFSANTLRVTNKGALIEESRTNSVRNNSMTGAAAGSPGTLPTTWGVSSANGLTTAVSALTTVSGIDTIDLHISGTTSGTFYVFCYESSFTQITASVGQVWTESFWVALTAGDLTNVSSIKLDVRWAGAGATSDQAFTPTPTLTRINEIATAPAAATFVNPCFVIFFNSGVAIDLTLRVGWPQLELGAFVTSPIRTTSATVTRAADVVTLTTVPTFGTAYTLFGKGTPNAPLSYSVSQSLLSADDGTTNNRTSFFRASSTGKAGPLVLNAGAGWNPGGSTLVSSDLSAKLSLAAAASDQAFSVNGGIATNATTTPITPTTVHIGIRADGVNTTQWNGYVERVAIWPITRLPNARLQALTSP